MISQSKNNPNQQNGNQDYNNKNSEQNNNKNNNNNNHPLFRNNQQQFQLGTHLFQLEQSLSWAICTANKWYNTIWYDWIPNHGSNRIISIHTLYTLVASAGWWPADVCMNRLYYINIAIQDWWYCQLNTQICIIELRWLWILLFRYPLNDRNKWVKQEWEGYYLLNKPPHSFPASFKISWYCSSVNRSLSSGQTPAKFKWWDNGEVEYVNSLPLCFTMEPYWVPKKSKGSEHGSQWRSCLQQEPAERNEED